MGSVPDEQRGAAAGVNNTTRELGGTLGVAVFGSIFASAYAPRIISAFGPLPIPAGPKTEAHQSMAAALAVVKRAPHSVQPFLERSAFDAFHSGLLVACIAGAVVAALGAVGAWMLLPGRNAPASLPGGAARDDVEERTDAADDAQLEGCPEGLAPLPA
jgi:hypothetical protein